MSDLDNLSCAICFCLYDNNGRIPKLLPNCGHSVCLNCLNYMLIFKKINCPHGCVQSSTQESTFPTNWTLLYLIEEKLQTRTDLQTYDFDQLNNTKNEATLKRKELESLLSEFANEKQKIQDLVAEGKRRMKASIKEELDKIRDRLAEKEEEFYESVDYVFRLEEKITNDVIEKDNVIKEKCELQISDLIQNVINKRFLKTLKKSPPTFQICKEYQRLAEVIPNREKECRTFLESFSDSFLPIFEESQSLFGYEGDLEEFYNPSLPQIIDLLKVKIMNSELSIGLKNDDWKDSTTQEFNSKNLKKIKTVNLDFSRDWLTKEKLKPVEMFYQMIKNVYSLKINLNYSSEDKFDVSWLDSLWCKETIERFDISFYQAELNDSVMTQIIHHSFKRLGNLKYFSVDFGYTCIKDQNMQTLVLDLKSRAPNLLSLTLNLYNTQITDTGAMSLSLGLGSYVQNLKVLKLSFYQTKITDTGISLLSRFLIGHANNVNDFSLLIGKNQITDKSIQELCGVLKFIGQNIKYFALGLDETGITDKSMNSLCNDVLQSLTAIECFELYLDNTEVTDKGISLLCDRLKDKLSFFCQFVLNLSKTKITDHTILRMGKDIIPLMHNLTFFELSLDETKVTDKSIKPLISSLNQNIEKLEEVSLSLRKTCLTESDFEPLITDHINSCVKFRIYKETDQ